MKANEIEFYDITRDGSIVTAEYSLGTNMHVIQQIKIETLVKYENALEPDDNIFDWVYDNWYYCTKNFIIESYRTLARKEREAQLVGQYNQKPVSQNKPLWLLDVEKVSSDSVNRQEVIEAVLGIILVAVLLGIAIFIF